MTNKSRNPTPEERDERLSLYGLDPQKVIETILNADDREKPTAEEEAVKSRARKSKP